MHIRQASLNDREKWDSFVNNERGTFFQLFDWKEIYEVKNREYIPLLFENESSDILAILPIVKIRNNFYSSLVSLPEGSFGGVVFKKNILDSEKNKIISLLIEYISTNFSNDCSNFILKENPLLLDKKFNQPTDYLIQNKFRYLYDDKTELPCTYLLELKQQFENCIWDQLWDHRLRNKIRKSQKKGVYVEEDKNLQFMDDFLNMFITTNIRLGIPTLTKNEIAKRLTVFGDKTKLFVAFLEEEPIACLLCYYHSSICYLSKLPSYEKARNYDANTLLAYEAIRYACKNDYKYCEFGITDTASLTRWKEQFKGIKIPLRIYEKRYSSIRNIFEKVPTQIKWAITHKNYLWCNKCKILKKILKRNV